MPRPPRPVADGLVYHALNRGNNRASVFFLPEDYAAFLRALAQSRERYPFRLYGYCLLTNHFHLLLEPEPGQSVSRILQSLTVAHTWHYPKAKRTVGHVWQGRFKSPVVACDEHALTVLRYVESNPLRACMVSDLADYPWCSYGVHGLGQEDSLVSPLPCSGLLGREEAARQSAWRALLHTPLTERELAAVRKSVSSGRPYGAAAWAATTTARLGLFAEPKKRGRPRKVSEL